MRKKEHLMRDGCTNGPTKKKYKQELTDTSTSPVMFVLQNISNSWNSAILDVENHFEEGTSIIENFV